jgi:pimeloyl-ACP methyl ester carboxylesterase
MIRRAAFVLCLPLLAATDASPQQAAWRDPSAHATRLITVDEGVQLEVLDWGGSGPAIVLLAGLGDTAHVFDDFAPMLTARYRVIGVSRRAHGRSSAPATGYGFARLAEDVVRAIDAVGVDKPVLVGHSIAGEELHVLGARYSAKLAGVVYIDAAFNRADGEDYDAAARSCPLPVPGLATWRHCRSVRFLRTRRLARRPPASPVCRQRRRNRRWSVDARPSDPSGSFT